MRRAAPGSCALAALAVALAACAPLRVDVDEQAAGGYVASVHGDDADECRDAPARAREEARYFCEARGRHATLGTVASEASGEGCHVELPFWCTGGT